MIYNKNSEITWLKCMVAKLVAEEGILKGLTLSFGEGDQWVIGRDPDACQLIVEDPSASRKHLICRTTPEGFILENLSHTNPVTVNNEELQEPRILENGDEVKIGGGIYRFLLDVETEVILPDEEEEPDLEGIFDEEPEMEKFEEEEPSETAENTAETPSETEKEVEEETIPPEEEKPLETAKKEPEEEEPSSETIFEDEITEEDNLLAEINFDMLDTGRFLLKVISGPNNGAEFSMKKEKSYTIGTDPNTCDIIFHDNSVSRQHARVSIGDDDNLTIQDLNSRNGTLVDGKQIEGEQPLPANTLINVGTTSFVIFDREGEMQTIISPLMPQIVKVLQNDEEAKATSEQISEEEHEELAIAKQKEKSHTLGAFIIIGIIMAVFVVTGLGVTTLFRAKPIDVQEEVDYQSVLAMILKDHPQVTYHFNSNTSNLFLSGHVLDRSEKDRLLFNLSGLEFINDVDYKGVIIDNNVRQEINQILAKNPKWRGVTILTPQSGKFVIQGYLKTHNEFEALSDYITQNFQFLDLLENRVIVEEDIISSVSVALRNSGMPNIDVTLVNGELNLRGNLSPEKLVEFQALLPQFRKIPGVSAVRPFISEVRRDTSLIDVSDKYTVTGYSNQGGVNVSVVINGKILSRGHTLDGMTITSIRPNAVFLEKDGVKYRININR